MDKYFDVNYFDDEIEDVKEKTFDERYPEHDNKKYTAVRLEYKNILETHELFVEYFELIIKNYREDLECVWRDPLDDYLQRYLKNVKPPKMYMMTIAPKNAETPPLVLIGKMREVWSKFNVCRGLYTIERFGSKGERNHIHFWYEGKEIVRKQIERIFGKFNFQQQFYNAGFEGAVKYIRDPKDKLNDGKKERKKADAVWRSENKIKEFYTIGNIGVQSVPVCPPTVLPSL